MNRILDFFRRCYLRLDPGAEPSTAELLAPHWAAERRMRQHRPFVVDRADLFVHGIDSVSA